MNQTEQHPWKVLEHGPLEQIAENIWRVEGELPNVKLRRHMIIARDDENRLWIHNGICTDEKTSAAIEALGELTWLVVPNDFHRLDAARFKARYPQIEVFSPRGSTKKIQSKVAVDHCYEDWPKHARFSVEYAAGVKEREGIWSIQSDDGVTLVFNDLLFNQPHLPGVFGFVYKSLGQSGAPKVTFVAKMLMVKDKNAFKEQLQRLAHLDNLVRVIPGHIEPILENAPAILQHVAEQI